MILEPIFVKHGVNVVFSGHDHVYERLKPQKGIFYFVSGAAGQLRRGNMKPTENRRRLRRGPKFHAGRSLRNELHYRAISRTGSTVDAGVIQRQGGAGATERKPEHASEFALR